MGLHLAILAAAARGHRKRHGNARRQRRLRPILRNHKLELHYKYELLRLVKHVRALVEGELASLEEAWKKLQGAASSAPVVLVRAADTLPKDAAEIIRKVKSKLGGLDTFAQRLTKAIVTGSRDSVDRRLATEIKRSIGVDVSGLLMANGQLLHSMEFATKANIALIQSIPTQYLDRVQATVSDAWAQGIRWESVVEKIAEDGAITENRAKLIARDQTSKMNAALNQERQQQVGIERFDWVTAEDERVRDSHAGLDGQTFDWNNPPIVDGEPATPGTPINCRCVAIPVVDMEELSFAAGSAEETEEIAA